MNENWLQRIKPVAFGKCLFVSIPEANDLGTLDQNVLTFVAVRDELANNRSVRVYSTCNWSPINGGSSL